MNCLIPWWCECHVGVQLSACCLISVAYLYNVCGIMVFAKLVFDIRIMCCIYSVVPIRSHALKNLKKSQCCFWRCINLFFKVVGALCAPAVCFGSHRHLADFLAVILVITFPVRFHVSIMLRPKFVQHVVQVVA